MIEQPTQLSAASPEPNEVSQPSAPPATALAQAGQPVEQTPSKADSTPVAETAAPDMNIKIKHAHTSEMNFISINGELDEAFPNQKSNSRWFTLNVGCCVSTERQEENFTLFAETPAAWQRLRQKLLEQPLLVLSGEAYLGKTTAALYLSQALREADSRARDTYLIPTPEQQIKFDLSQSCAAEGAFSGRLLIFKDAFAQRNRALLDFFAQLTPASLDNFSQMLRQNNVYLIFTTVPAACGTLLPVLRENHLLQELEPLEQSCLLKALDRKLVAYEKKLPPMATELFATAQKRLALLREKSAWLSERLTLPRLLSFCEYFLGQQEATADLAESLLRFDDIAHWFEHGLAADFDSWCFAFTLGISHQLSATPGVSWFDFEQLRREVRQCFRRDPEMFPPRRPSIELDAAKNGAHPAMLPDSFFLEKCRAEIVRDPASLTELIHFCDPDYARQLWEIILRQHRRQLYALLPRLWQLTDFRRADGARTTQRLFSAQLLGRLGELAPERIAGDWLEHCLEHNEVRARPLAGAFYQGILSSKNERYRYYFLQRLQKLGNSPATGPEKHHLLIALAVHSQIGALVEPTWVLNELKRIAERELVPMLHEGRKLARLLHRTEDALREQPTLADALNVSFYREFLQAWAERLYAERLSAFVYTQYALSALCLKADPILVFKDLRHWMETTDALTGALVALMFLLENGIAARLEAERVDISSHAGTAAETCNPLILALTGGPTAVRELAQFLVTMYESFAALPSEFRRYLHESFLLHLTNWVEESLSQESSRTALLQLFEELMMVHQKALFRPLQDWLESQKFRQNDSSPKQAFADAVLAAVLWR